MSAVLKSLLKFLHEIGAAGVMGSLATCLVLVLTAPAQPLSAAAAVFGGVAQVMHWVLVPSLAAVTVSGLLAIAVNPAYHNAGWAWTKALLGISVFEGTLLTAGAGGRQAADLSLLAANGVGDSVQLAAVIHAERGGLCVLLALSLVNIVLAVWRPRFGRRAGSL